MPLIYEHIETIQSLAPCRIDKSQGQPALSEGLNLPPDLMDYYGRYGQIVIEPEECNSLTVLPASRFVRANPVLVGQTITDDRSHNWFVLAEYTGEYITIDLNPDTLGRCYDSFWDRHAVKGSCPIIAGSFTEFLELISKSLSTDGDPFYWEGGRIGSLGDAYDLPK